MTSSALSALSIVKEFGSGKNRFLAVNNLSFDLKEGESVAFLGPNGAGKSTTIKILCGILSPTSGSAKIAGYLAGTIEANKRLGLVFGTRSQLYMHMTVRQCLDLIAEIYFLTGTNKNSRIGELSELFEIGHLLESRVRTLSLGQRMRCEIVAALLHRPKILLADEPTIGLDVVAKNKLRKLILRWQKEEKSTLLLTSHDLSDVEALCDRCVLIDHGEKRFDGPLKDLKGDLASVRRIQITLSEPGLSILATEKRIHILNQDDFVHRYEIRTTDLPMSEAMSALSSHYGDRLQDLQIGEVSLEEVLGERYEAKLNL